MENKPRKLTALLGQNGQLGHLGRMLRQQQALLQEVRQLLPSPLRSHCIHARISGQRLILHTDSPAWGSKLRFHGPQLLEVIMSQAPNVRKVDVRIFLEERPLRSKKPLGPLSGAPAARITELADSLNDARLSMALRRLVKTQKK